MYICAADAWHNFRLCNNMNYYTEFFEEGGEEPLEYLVDLKNKRRFLIISKKDLVRPKMGPFNLYTYEEGKSNNYFFFT